MKKTSALAVIDFANIPAGVWAVDAILKKAPIAFVRAGTVTRGRYLLVFGGSTASTAESLAEALTTSGQAVIDHALLPDVHPHFFRQCSAREENPPVRSSSWRQRPPLRSCVQWKQRSRERRWN